MDQLQITPAVARILKAFLEDPTARRYGFELMRMTGLQSGSLYPVLARLERAGWVVGEREVIDPSVKGRPPRRYYVLTRDGAVQATTALALLSEQYRPPTLGAVLDRLQSAADRFRASEGLT